MTLVMPGDSVTTTDHLPDGVTQELSERLRALMLELNGLGLTVILAISDAQGKALGLAKGDAGDLGALIAAIAPSVKAEVPCPICQARQSGGSARA